MVSRRRRTWAANLTNKKRLGRAKRAASAFADVRCSLLADETASSLPQFAAAGLTLAGGFPILDRKKVSAVATLPSAPNDFTSRLLSTAQQNLYGP